MSYRTYVDVRQKTHAHHRLLLRSEIVLMKPAPSIRTGAGLRHWWVVGWLATHLMWICQAGTATHIGPRLVWTISASTAYREPLMSFRFPQLN